VLRVSEQLKVPLELKNIQESSASLEELKRLTGRTQVPCLVIDGKPMLESEDIVSRLEEYCAASK
jgi:glutaredoxin